MENLRRISLIYIVFQVIIWVKSFVFFYYFGHGKVLLFSLGFFPKEVLLPDFIFHESMHLMIGVLAVLFGKNLEKFDLKQVVPIILAAVFLHNIAYWLTSTHPTLLHSVTDFGVDSALLVSFVFAGFILGRWTRFAQLKVPLFEVAVK